MSYPNDNLMDRLDAMVSDAAVASAALGTLASGSDAVVDNFAGLQDLVDALSSFASTMKSGAYYAPVGLIAPFGGLSGQIPEGWFLCNGDPKSTSTYADLYAVLGTNAYGTDSGGNFYLPDLRGRVPFGLNADNSDVSARTNTENATTANRSPKHKHTSSLTATSGGVDHNHGYSRSYLQTSNTPGVGENWPAGGGAAANVTAYTTAWAYGGNAFPATGGASAYAHTHAVSGTVGVGSGTNDTVPYVVTNYIIKW